MSAISTAESATAVELPRESQKIRIRRRDHDGILLRGARREERRGRVLAVLDTRVIEPDGEVGRPFARGDYFAARELLERHVPQPRRIASVGAACVDRDDDRAALVGQ